MADLLIKGLSLPEKDENIMIIIESNGEVWKRIDTTAYFCTGYKAVEVPPHGRAIDADRLPVSTLVYHQANGVEIETLELKVVYLKDLHNAPTVLETSE